MHDIRLICAACRIGIYRFYNYIRGYEPPPPKPQKHVVVIGLAYSGKSAALALVAGEQIDDIEPTNGFHIKDVALTDCLLTAKEIGGSIKIRKYWSHYFGGAQGVIYMVNGSFREEELEDARVAMVDALNDPQLQGLPILLLVTHQDVETAKSATEISELWQVKERYKERVMVYSSSIKRIPQLKTAFNAFGTILVKGIVSPSDIDLSDNSEEV